MSHTFKTNGGEIPAVLKKNRRVPELCWFTREHICVSVLKVTWAPSEQISVSFRSFTRVTSLWQLRFSVLGSLFLEVKQDLRSGGNKSVILTDRPPHRHMAACQRACSLLSAPAETRSSSPKSPARRDSWTAKHQAEGREEIKMHISTGSRVLLTHEEQLLSRCTVCTTMVLRALGGIIVWESRREHLPAVKGHSMLGFNQCLHKGG